MTTWLRKKAQSPGIFAVFNQVIVCNLDVQGASRAKTFGVRGRGPASGARAGAGKAAAEAAPKGWRPT